MNKPYYDKDLGHWRVNVDGQIEEGDVLWCVCEYIRDSLFYKLGDGDHVHSFEGVLEKIIECSLVENIEGDRTQYSDQELRIIDKLKEKLHS